MPRALLLSLLVVATSCGDRDHPAPVRPAARPGPRVTMAALHATGGVPPGWHFTPPPGDPRAGRQAFMDFGCFACHAIAGESFAGEKNTGDRVGPELTGMGAHHPAEYFAEAILNPDAVLVDGPGYIGPDGHSLMPSYPDLTLGQLADLVAYLQSLGGPHDHAAMAGAATRTNPNVIPLPADVVQALQAPQPQQLPAPPATKEGAFLVMSYRVNDGKLAALEEWFRDKGAGGFLAAPGLTRIDTFVDRTRTPSITTVWAFENPADMHRFESDPAFGRLGLEFDAFIGDHDHRPFHDEPPLYQAPSLSAARR